MNTKPDRIKFVKGAAEILKELNFTPEKCDDSSSSKEKDVFVLVTDKNELKAILYEEADHKNVYSVFMKFKAPVLGLGNQFSGKNNFHKTLHSVGFTLIYFKSFLQEAVDSIQ